MRQAPFDPRQQPQGYYQQNQQVYYQQPPPHQPLIQPYTIELPIVRAVGSITATVGALNKQRYQ